MQPLIDSHAHLTDDRFASDLDGVLSRAEAAFVTLIVTIASDLEDAELAARLARSHHQVYATAGIHPHAASSADEGAFAGIVNLANDPRVVAIGETGLDFHYDNSPRADQIASFERHLEIARTLDMPVIVHAREADDEVRAILRNAGWGRGVLHCFSGSAALLDDALQLGWHVSFAGIITFPRWDGADLLRRVPTDRLLVETDSPYLAPVPHRGRRNEPAFVRVVADRAAELRNEDSDDLADATTRNARALYGIGTVLPN